MDDLIRRSDTIEEVYKRIGADLDIDDVEYFEKIINSVPTAYNVDKVVEQVKDNTKLMMPVIETEKVIELIKAGGVNE